MRLYDTWLEHFDDLYHMIEMMDRWGQAPGLFTIAGVALLIHPAHLDTSGISFTEWFEGVPTFDVSAYHHQEADGRSW